MTNGFDDIAEGDQVKITGHPGNDAWIVTAVVGEGADQRFHLVHVNYPAMTQKACRDRITPVAQSK